MQSSGSFPANIALTVKTTRASGNRWTTTHFDASGAFSSPSFSYREWESFSEQRSTTESSKVRKRKATRLFLSRERKLSAVARDFRKSKRHSTKNLV